MKKLAKKLNEYFSKDDKYMANKHMKRYSTSQVREMLMKTTVSYHLILLRMATYQKKRKETTMPPHEKTQTKQNHPENKCW